MVARWAGVIRGIVVMGCIVCSVDFAETTDAVNEDEYSQRH